MSWGTGWLRLILLYVPYAHAHIRALCQGETRRDGQLIRQDDLKSVGRDAIADKK